MTKQIANIGDVFEVPLDDKSSVLGQIVEIEKEVLNCITCVFFYSRNEKSINTLKPISIQFVTKDLFNSGKWKRIGNEKVQIPETSLPYRETKENGWVGAKVIGSGIIVKFLSAFYGQRQWNEMKDPNYYNNLLLPGVNHVASA